MSEIGTAEGKRTFKEQAAKYASVIRWLFGDSAWRFRWLFAAIIGAGLLGMSAQGWSIGLAIMYSKSLQSGRVFNILDYHFEPRTSIALLVLVALVILVSLALSALLIFFSDAYILKLRKRYEQFCAGRVIKTIGTNIRFFTSTGEPLNDKEINKLIRTDSRFCGKSLGMFAGLLVPSITFVVATGVLFYINAPLTALILCLLLVMGKYLYAINVGGAKSTVSKERYSSIASSEYRQVILRIRNTLAPVPKNDEWLTGKLFEKGAIKNYNLAYEGRLRAGVNSQFLNNLFLSVVVFSMMIILGSSIITHGSGWDGMVVYIVALQYALSNLKKATGQLTMLNRYYPMIKRYFDFVNLNPIARKSPAPLAGNMIIKASADRIGGSLESVEITPESRINIVSPLEPNRYTIANIADSLFNGDRATSDFFLSDSALALPLKGSLPVSMRESVGFPEGYGEDDLRRDLEGADFYERLSLQKLASLDKPVKPETVEDADPELLNVLSLLASIRSGKKFLIVTTRCLSKIDDKWHDFFFRMLGPGQVLMKIQFHVRLQKLHKHADRTFVVSDGEKVVGIGDSEWFLKHIDEITAIPSLGNLTSDEDKKEEEKEKEDEAADEFELEDDEI